MPPFAPFARPQAAAHSDAGVPSTAPSDAEERESLAEDAAPFTPAAIEADEDTWMPWEDPEASGQAGAEPVSADDTEDDLPWLVPEAVEEASPAVEAAADAEELPTWLSWDDAVEEADAPAAVDAGADSYAAAAPFSLATEPESIDGEPEVYAGVADAVEEVASWNGAEEPAAEMEHFYAVEENAAAEAALYAPAPEVEHPEAVGPGVGALAEVADRLERIAQSLRERPGDVLAGGDGAADPLELLITGFALGYAQGRGRDD